MSDARLGGETVARRRGAAAGKARVVAGHLAEVFAAKRARFRVRSQNLNSARIKLREAGDAAGTARLEFEESMSDARERRVWRA